jgi:hypothetical protein
MYKRTTDHDEIRAWVEAHGGQPAALRTADGDVGVVRLNFRPGSTPPLHPLTWEEFFETFEERKLAFIYADDVPKGQEDRVTKLVTRKAS